MEAVRLVKELRKPFRAIYPTPVALVTSVSPEGRPNIITLAEVGMPCIADPLVIGLAINPGRYSHGLIRETGEFVVNLPPVGLLREVDYCGTVSGRDVDKFRETGLTPEPATHVRPPLIKECPVNIECRLMRVTPLGYHDFFMGEGLAVHVDEAVLDDRGRLDFSKARPLVYNGGEYWSCGERLGRHGFTRALREHPRKK